MLTCATSIRQIKMQQLPIAKGPEQRYDSASEGVLRHMSGGPINLPKFLPISFFRRVSRFIGVSGHLAFQ